MDSIQNIFNLVASCDEFDIVMKSGIPYYRYHGNSYVAKFKSGWSLESVYMFDRKVEEIKQKTKRIVISVDEDEEQSQTLSRVSLNESDTCHEEEDCSSRWLDVDIISRNKRTKIYSHGRKSIQKNLEPYQNHKKLHKKLIRTRDNDIKSWENQQTIPVDRECNDEVCDVCWDEWVRFLKKKIEREKERSNFFAFFY